VIIYEFADVDRDLLTIKAFDVPPGTQAAELEVHDSMFSGGAKVQLV
jgi:hypothetical protein